MKVLFCGDAVVSTGFSRCTHMVCDALHAAGHEVHVLGLNYFGDPHKHPYSIYPCRQPLDGGRDLFGVTRLPVLMDRIDPDVVVLLNDPWNIPAYLNEISQWKFSMGQETTPVVAWLAVDGENIKGRQLNAQQGGRRGLDLAITWTQFGADQLRSGGYTGAIDIVPLGIDLSMFGQKNQRLSRKLVVPADIPENGFIVGVVGRNQPRKRIDLAMQYFAHWIALDAIDDAYLYLHVAPTGDSGCDIMAMAEYYKLFGRLVISTPEIGMGVDNERMASVYSSFDALLSTSQGEGWGLPVHEAMACGVPCIVPNWSALGEWPRGAVIEVTCSSTALTAPINSMAYTVGGIPDERETIDALRSLYHSKKTDSAFIRDLRGRGFELVNKSELQAANVGKAMVKKLEEVCVAKLVEVSEA